MAEIAEQMYTISIDSCEVENLLFQYEPDLSSKVLVWAVIEQCITK